MSDIRLAFSSAYDLSCTCGSRQFGRPDREHTAQCDTKIERWVIHVPADHWLQHYWPPVSVQRISPYDAIVAFLCAHGQSYRVSEIEVASVNKGGEYVTYRIGDDRHSAQYGVEFLPHWRTRMRAREAPRRRWL